MSKVQRDLSKHGLTLVVFDCFRPIRAVDDFVAWTKLGGPADPQWFPSVPREKLIEKGYIGALSSHSRGSTVDLAIASASTPGKVRPGCGAPDADMLDFGTGFDCFDPSSETAHRPLSSEAAANRDLLLSAMKAHGFRNYSREWWHFTLRGEPYPKERFDGLIR